MIKFPRKHRISIDLDTRNQLKLLKAYYNMKRLSSKVVVYRTRKGYHIQGWFRDRTAKQNMDVRMLLGDDVGRLQLDSLRLAEGYDENIETLFVLGKTVKGVKSMEEPFDILSEQFWGFRL